MSKVALEIVVLLVLILANGVFAMAEMAFVASRKPRLLQLAGQGHPQAALALEMAGAPTRFLSTVQLGITLIGIFAGAFGGATIAGELAAVLRRVDGLGAYADGCSLALVVFAITLLSLVLGELVPKRLALHQPERIALWLASPMHRLSVWAGPAISLLVGATNLLLRPLRLTKPAEPAVSEDDIRTLIEQGHHAGVFHRAEIGMVEGVMALDQRPITELMTPAHRIVWLDADDSDETNWRRIVASHHTTFPVRHGGKGGGKGGVLGFVSVKSIWANLAAGVPARLRDLVTPALVVRGDLTAIALLELFQRNGRRFALVGESPGAIIGLVTRTDLVNSILDRATAEPSQDRAPVAASPA